MKPAPFRYFAPETTDEAIALMAEHPEARPLAGGQSLIPAMNFRLARPEALVDLSGIADLRGIDTTDEGALRIGAMTSQRRVERDATVRAHCPLLREAVRSVGHAQIRARGTIGGSIAHADPAAEIPAAILTGRGTLHLRGPAGPRVLPAEDFFVGLMATAIGEAELLVAVELPRRRSRSGQAFVEVARRPGDYALAGVAAEVVLDEDGRIGDVRLALVAIGGAPSLSATAGDLLRGREPEPESFAAAAEATAGAIDPPSDIHASADFRRHLVRVLVKRALANAARRAASDEARTPER